VEGVPCSYVAFCEARGRQASQGGAASHRRSQVTRTTTFKEPGLEAAGWDAQVIKQGQVEFGQSECETHVCVQALSRRSEVRFEVGTRRFKLEIGPYCTRSLSSLGVSKLGVLGSWELRRLDVLSVYTFIRPSNASERRHLQEN
jgi:hypothetical protein